MKRVSRILNGKARTMALALMLMATGGRLMADDIHVVTDGSNEDFVVATPATRTTLVVAEGDAEVVATAAACLADDIRAVTGQPVAVATAAELGALAASTQTAIDGATTTPTGCPVVAGTIGQSPLIDALAAAGKINVADVQGLWEVYGLQMVDYPAEGVEHVDGLNKENGRSIIKHKYLGGPTGCEVWLYEVVNGPHSWFDHDLDTGEEIWSFFSKYLK